LAKRTKISSDYYYFNSTKSSITKYYQFDFHFGACWLILFCAGAELFTTSSSTSVKDSKY